LIFEALGGDLLGLLEDIESNAKPLIGIFFEAARQGDPPVMRLVDQMALRGAQLITAHLRVLDFADPVEIVLAGSIHTKLPNEAYVERLIQKARELSGRALTFSKLAREPVMGCVDWILEGYA